MTLPELITPFADYDFMRRALAGASMLTLGATPVGVFLMLRRMSLMADAMSHAVLPVWLPPISSPACRWAR